MNSIIDLYAFYSLFTVVYDILRQSNFSLFNYIIDISYFRIFLLRLILLYIHFLLFSFNFTRSITTLISSFISRIC